ncbi:Cof-type HAD-IIB family hydrolase [Corynebacterium camporealensis]|uniref:Putative HAD superfamily hydrolase n=1 Tax=Corynebacterium camporealensis TaxID=161896 RepID=A0A0F6QXP0_9CORY|nr:Cof-type HAD-IIB family hydrolase [Corynebacterium camporealensis]AKE40097.1 putative HAD superfamily hydrolase [Corynebacterium camporealensis]
MFDSAPAPRLIASDIDGTFLDPNHRVSKRNRDAVLRAHQAGTHFVLATGRPHRWIAPVLDQLPLRPLCVTANGAVLYDADSDNVLEAHEVAPGVLSHVVDIAKQAFAPHGGVSFAVERAGKSVRDPLDELFVVDHSYSEEPVFDGFGIAALDDLVSVPAVKLLVRNLHLSAPEMYDVLAPHVDQNKAHVTYSMNEGILEVAAPGVTKAKGLDAVAQHFNVTAEQTITFGDMPNDIEMLQWAGTGVAMGNAAPAVKEAADFVTTPNSESGVANVLERWF